MVDTDLDTPSWLNKDFLTTILQKEDPSKHINVLSYSTQLAVPKGNNYVCIVIRVKVEYEKDDKPASISLIIKTPYTEGEGATWINEFGIVQKEYAIYKELLPIMNKMTDETITPKDFLSPMPGTLILEDLSEQGYVMCDRIKQLDFEHCNILMKVLAKFHALSLQLHKQDPEMIERLGEEPFFREDKLNDEMINLFHNGINSLASAIEEWEGFTHFAKFIRNNESNIREKMYAFYINKEKLRVLNHGDLWTNNMLFKHDETGKVIDVKLIDLQVCRLASPAVDLNSFITSSAQEDVKKYRLQELYATYLHTFNSTLEAVGCEERLSEEGFQDELKFAEYLPFYLLIFYLPIVLNERNNAMDMDETMNAFKSSNEETKEPLKKMLDNKYYKDVAQYTLKKMEELGFLTSF